MRDALYDLLPIGNLKAGDLICNRYKVVRKLGSGATGIVYLCLDQTIGDLAVAVKLIHQGASSGNLNMVRIARELRISHSINHDNVTRFYDLAHHEGTYALVMEYVEGCTLADLIDQQKMPMSAIHALLTQVSQGLSAIHKRGVIHRDLKPENIMVSSDGLCKISDFGLVKETKADHDEKYSSQERKRPEFKPLAISATAQGDVVGTPLYLSPEYLSDCIVDQRSDIYALGLIAFEMIAGELPYKFKSFSEFIEAKLSTVPPPLIKVNKSCPEALSRIVSKCVESDPEKRYQHVDDVLTDLSQIKFSGKFHVGSRVSASTSGILMEEMNQFRIGTRLSQAPECTVIPSRAQRIRRSAAEHLTLFILVAIAGLFVFNLADKFKTSRADVTISDPDKDGQNRPQNSNKIFTGRGSEITVERLGAARK